MPSRLPPDFDADWYAGTYRDVGLSGLSPREHYLRFGSLLGRPARGQVKPEVVKPAPELVAEPVSPPPPPRPAVDPAPRPALPKVDPLNTASKPIPKKASIIDRPAGFDPLAVVPRPAPLRAGEGSGGLFSLDTVANLEDSGTLPAAVAEAMQAYARLLRLQLPHGGGDKAAISCGASAFQAGPARIENAWLPAPSRLRLMLVGHEGGATPTGDLSLRVYQADPAAPGDLHILGQGVQLPSSGPVLHDLELRQPLMPLLLELSDSGGATRALALLPFPSLLPGGLHGAELKALQTEPNPIDDFWALSEALLQEAVGRDGSPPRSVACVSGARQGGRADQPLLAQEVQDWISAIFGVVVDGSGAADAEGAQLRLPPDYVPTISALASRGLSGGGTATMVGPYLVAEAGSYRPRWSIAVPPAVDQDGAIPSLQNGDAPSDGAMARETAPIPLAIAIRSPADPSPNPPPAKPSSAGTTPLSVVLHASDPVGVERLIHSMRAAMKEVEWLVRSDDTGGDLRVVLDRACGAGGWVQLAKGDDLRGAASKARHETLLTICDRVDVGDGGALRSIIDLLNRDGKVASAACALLAEKIVKRDVVLQPASGGLFPTGVSFVSGPRLAFGEPDALQALPDLAYPVVANTLLFTAWRRSALAELSPVTTTSPSNVEDIRIGLDLMRAGFSNWCTTKVTARLSGPYVPRDQIDPVGAGYMRAVGWEEILSRVTVIRELF